MTDERPRTFWVASGLVTLLAAAVRFYHLGGDSLWFDEVLTVNTARAGWAAALDLRDHPPLLYWLTTLSIRALGESEWSLRLPSALAATAAVPLLIAWGAVSKRPWAGLWAGLLLALSPFHLRYAHEARHYALLMLFSTAALLCLTVALRQKSTGFRWWGLFALATALNLYTHYSAYLLLAAQLAVIAGWWLWQLTRQRVLRWQPLLAGGVIGLLLLPWLPRLATAVRSNAGETAAFGTTGISSIGEWVRGAFAAFGFWQEWAAVATAVLCITGVGLWLWQREGWLAALALATLTLPFVLITSGQIARSALPKYIIYMLPVYLLAAGTGLHVLGRALPLSGRRRVWVGAGLAVLVTAVLLPGVAAEHAHVKRDWRGLVEALRQVADADDLFVVLNLDLEDGFNQGGIAAPYYLDQAFGTYTLLDGNRLRLEQLTPLVGSERDVWVLTLHRTAPLTRVITSLRLSEFAGSLYLLHAETAAPPLVQLQTIYEALLPTTRVPTPRCLVEQGVATVQAAVTDFEAANATLNAAIAHCPQPVTDGQLRADLQTAVQEGLIAHYTAAGQPPAARRVAQALLVRDRDNKMALATLTVADLLQLWRAGEAVVAENGAPEPVEVRTFTMPQNGETYEALFVHPPAAVSFPLTLPHAPLQLVTAVAMAPESWAWGGDGSTFVVEVDGEEAVRQHVSNALQDQRWHLLQVPLDAYAGETITITLRTEAGTAEDATGDWAGWGVPRVLWRGEGN